MTKDDYDLSELEQIEVRNLAFNIMPRYRYHYIEKDYEKFSLDLVERLVTPGSVALDIGAHYGIYSLIAARTAAQVYAFEPVPENCSILAKNAKDNKFKNIKAINKAVSDSKGTVDFNVTWASDSAGFYEHPNAESVRTIQIETAAIDAEISEKRPISFVKIDTEGHELHVLAGLSKTIAKHHPKMLIEFNPECLERAGSTAEDLLVKLESLGYDLFAVYEDGRDMARVTSATPTAHILRGGTYLNLLCLPQGVWISMIVASHSSSIGGAELVLQSVVESLVARTDIFVLPYMILPAEGPLNAAFDRLAIPRQVVNFDGWVNHDSDADRAPETLEGRRALNANALATISHVFEEFQPQVAMSNTIVVPWLATTAQAFGVPHVWSIHEFGDLDHGFRFDETMTASLRYIDQTSVAVVANSDIVKEHLARIIPAQKIQRIYPAVATPEVPQADLPDVFSKDAQLKLVLVGYLGPAKGQEEAIKALARVRAGGVQAELVLVGRGVAGYEDTLKQLIVSLSLDTAVHIVGQQDNPAAYVTQADIVLMCSRSEAFGRVTVEGMLLEKPVVGAAAGGTKEVIVDGKTGLLYPAGDTEALAACIIRLQDAKLRKTLGKAGFRRAQELFVGDRADELFAVLRTAAAQQISSPLLARDIYAGFAALRRAHQAEIQRMIDFHAKELQDFSDNYNRVYEAYHHLEAVIAARDAQESRRLKTQLRKVARKVRAKARSLKRKERE